MSFSIFTSGPKKFQKLSWAHRPSKPTIYFLEMSTPMGESLCHLVRLDVKEPKIGRFVALWADQKDTYGHAIANKRTTQVWWYIVNTRKFAHRKSIQVIISLSQDLWHFQIWVAEVSRNSLKQQTKHIKLQPLTFFRPMSIGSQQKRIDTIGRTLLSNVVLNISGY